MKLCPNELAKFLRSMNISPNEWKSFHIYSLEKYDYSFTNTEMFSLQNIKFNKYAITTCVRTLS